MKICAIICEYNPFHNGHLYQLNEAKKRTNADAILCLMSGNFVQRGEAAILHKNIRAQHAIKAGADIVIELPTVFATSNAELFAKGAMHILSSIPEVTTLCFGAENADKTAFYLAARYLNNEPPEVSEAIKREVAKGTSYAKARAQAFAGFIPFDLLNSPNNILGLEYAKAIQKIGANIEILPIQRQGANYNDTALHQNFSSATAIRQAICRQENTSACLPDFVLQDLPSSLDNHLDALEKYALLSTPRKEIACVCDCTEGLENAFVKAASCSSPLEKSLCSPRYTASRIRRIALQNLLKIDEKQIRASLRSPLYLRVLATNTARKDVLSALGKGKFPLIVRSNDANKLSADGVKCYERDLFAEQIYSLLYPSAKIDKSIF